MIAISAMNMHRFLIVNADDFGLSAGVNEGIIASHQNGIVTSASLMVRGPECKAAAAYAKTYQRLSVGLHFDAGEWIYRNEQWEQLYQFVDTDDAGAVAKEAARQLEMFRTLMDADPTHLDSHQHVHRSEPVRSILMEMAATLGVPLRDCASPAQYRGDFYGQTGKGAPYPDAITIQGLVKVLHDLPEGITELGCHPGLRGDMETIYRVERAREVETLCAPEVRAAVVAAHIELISYRDLAAHGWAAGPARS